MSLGAALILLLFAAMTASLIKCVATPMEVGLKLCRRGYTWFAKKRTKIAPAVKRRTCWQTGILASHTKGKSRRSGLGAELPRYEASMQVGEPMFAVPDCIAALGNKCQGTTGGNN